MPDKVHVAMISSAVLRVSSDGGGRIVNPSVDRTHVKTGRLGGSDH